MAFVEITKKAFKRMFGDVKSLIGYSLLLALTIALLGAGAFLAAFGSLAEGSLLLIAGLLLSIWMS